MATLGIDIGGRFLKVVAAKSTGALEPVLDRQGRESTPTVVFIAADGRVYYGQDAVQQGRVDPTRLVKDFKLSLGSKDPVYGSFTAKDIYVLLFTEWKQRAEQQLREKVTSCVLARPANFRDEQSADLIDAAESVGMMVDAVITEPAAAVMDVLYNRKNTLDPQKSLLIACGDLGSTTYDNSLVEFEKGVATIRTTSGVRALGGKDLNQVVLNMVVDGATKLAGKPVSIDKLNPRQRFDLDRDVEEAKIALSVQAETDVPVPIGGALQMVRLDKSEFDRRCEPVLKPAVECFRQMLATANVAAGGLDLVVWAGAPFLSDSVRGYFDREVAVTGSREAHPVLAVARGAARHGLQLAVTQGRVSARSIPETAPKLREATTEDYGVAVVDASGGSRRRVCAVVLPKGRALPAHEGGLFRLERENQTRAVFEFLQGKDGAPVEQCTVIGLGELDGLPPEAARSERMEFEFRVDSSTMLTVQVRDKVSGKSTQVTLRRSGNGKGGVK